MDNRTIEQVRKNETKLINEIKNLEQQCKRQKEVIDKLKHILNNQMNYREFVDIVNDIEDVLKEVSEWLKNQLQN